MTPDELNAITAQVLDELDTAIGPLAAAYERLLRGAGRHIARRLRSQAVSLTAAAAFVPPNEDEVVPELRARIEKLTGRERRDLLRLLHKAYDTHGVPVETSFPPDLLEKIGAHASFATDQELRDIYRSVIEQASQEGLSVPNTAREIITRVDGVSSSRALALARTDLNGLANGASQAAATQAFSERSDVRKIWLATNDERTRETHADADGQEVGIDDHFDVGGSPMMYPGDPDGPDEEVINCRCTLVYTGGPDGSQPDEDQIAQALESWVGSPSTMRIHMGDELAGTPPTPGPATRLREQADALLRAVHGGQPSDVTLYRGSSGLRGDPRIPSSFTPDRSTARRFAGKEGTVQSYEPGEVVGVRMGDYISSSSDVREQQWVAVRERDVDRNLAGVTASVLPVAYAGAMSTDAATAAVTITVEDEAAAPAAARTPWEGPLAIEGFPTSDGRYLLPGEIGQRDLPLPVAPSHEAMRSTDTIGSIDNIERIPAAEFDKPGWENLAEKLKEAPPQAVVIWAEGSFSDSERAKDALDNGVGVSLDLPIERQALIDAQTFEEVEPSALSEEQALGMMFGAWPEGYLRGIAGKIGGLSLAAIAAFEETTIRIVEDHALVASGFEIRPRRDEELIIEGLTAGAAPAGDLLNAVQAPLMPPREWFFRDEADEPTPITILPSGEFYGHLALWNTCHAGRANGAYSACMYAPHSRTGYSQFHLGAILCDDGSEVPVGRITIGTGHAPLHLSAAAARAHYDNTGTVVGLARAKDGVFGIWLSGVIKSDATPEQIRDFRMCPPSGDWRKHDYDLELQAALAVNVAGFPVARSQLALSASADSLEIATLILGPPDEDDRVEALRAEYDLQAEEDIDMLVELGVGEFCGVELAALNHVDFRDYSPEERRRMARSGEAMPDASFPIANCTDARNAIQAQGRGDAPQGRIVAHIRKRVRSLSCSGDIFDPYK